MVAKGFLGFELSRLLTIPPVNNLFSPIFFLNYLVIGGRGGKFNALLDSSRQLG